MSYSKLEENVALTKKNESSKSKRRDMRFEKLTYLERTKRFFNLFGLEVAPLYLLTTKEVAVVLSLAFIMLVLLLIAVFVYLPSHLSIMVERLNYYFTGSRINIHP